MEMCQCRWTCPHHDNHGLGDCPNQAEVDVVDKVVGPISVCRQCFDPNYQRLR
jgi:hypothetical protein